MDKGTIIVLGVTGDLSKRKILPALYSLMRDGLLKNCQIVGMGLEKLANAGDALDAASELMPTPRDAAVWQQLHQSFVYHAGDLTKEADMAALAQLVQEREKAQGLSGTRMVYLAVPPHLFCPITQLLVKTGVVQHQKKLGTGVWQRIVYEKPFGDDLASAQSINKCIAQNIDEAQAYRIDHYLAKDVVSNIALVRFTNIVFEPLWNNRYVESVQLILSEKVSIAGRGAFYDRYGVLKDVVQNHALQLLALTAMEAPVTLVGDDLRDAKAAVLKDVQLVDGLLGQYDGYRDEENVAADSTTPTFAALKLAINNERWQGVPFFVHAGKQLDKDETTIIINFKLAECRLESCTFEANRLVITVAPESGFKLFLNAREPGVELSVKTVSMDFCYSCLFPGTREAYEQLLQEIMLGHQEASVRFDEIEYAWQIMEQAEKLNMPLHRYKPRSAGPAELAAFAKKQNMGKV